MNWKERLQKLWTSLLRLNPYLVVALLGVVIMFTPGEGSVYSHLEYNHQKAQLTAEKNALMKQIEKDRARLDDLTFGREKLEKFAREHFLMKEEDEDLYLINAED